MNLETGLVWCYKCDKEVDNEMVEEIRESIFATQESLSDSEASLNSDHRTGLVNLGNTCYINSAAQVLLST